MEKKEQLYEGKAKKVFATDDPALVIVSYKDDATALDGLKKGTILGKGAVNNRMSDFLFSLLEKEGIPTHFVKELNDREALVRKVSIVPLEVIIRNIYRVCFQRPKQRPYKTNNFYAVLERQNQLDREVYQIVRKEKADPHRTKTDRSRHRKSEPNG